MRDLTAGRLMRTDVPMARLQMTITEFMKEFPAQSSSQWVVLTGPSGAYAGMVFVPDVHLAGVHGDTGAAGAVVDNEKERHVVGLLTEAHVLRRYTDELDKAHRELSGEGWIGDTRS